MVACITPTTSTTPEPVRLTPVSHGIVGKAMSIGDALSGRYQIEQLRYEPNAGGAIRYLAIEVRVMRGHMPGADANLNAADRASIERASVPLVYSTATGFVCCGLIQPVHIDDLPEVHAIAVRRLVTMGIDVERIAPFAKTFAAPATLGSFVGRLGEWAFKTKLPAANRIVGMNGEIIEPHKPAPIASRISAQTWDDSPEASVARLRKPKRLEVAADAQADAPHAAGELAAVLEVDDAPTRLEEPAALAVWESHSNAPLDDAPPVQVEPAPRAEPDDAPPASAEPVEDEHDDLPATPDAHQCAFHGGTHMAANADAWEAPQNEPATEHQPEPDPELAATPPAAKPARAKRSARATSTPTDERADEGGATTAAEPSDSWRAALIYRKTATGMKLANTSANLITILDNDDRWRGVLAYDEFREEIVKLRAPPWHAHDGEKDPIGVLNEDDATRFAAFFAREYELLDVRPANAVAAAAIVAKRRRFHPVREYLDALVWDATPRLNAWLSTYLAAEQSTYTAQIGPRALIGAVARVYEPGCKVDTVTVLEGTQGVKKSTALRVLAVHDEWFFDSELEIGNKDAPQALRGKWIVELAEMTALTGRDLEKTKAFLSSGGDTYRPSYARQAATFLRRWIGFGTTNASTYLRDDTGNRRWWPVRVAATGPIDLAALRRDRDQLWAEAVVRYQQHEPWHLETQEGCELAAAEQEERLTVDAWEQPIVRWLARRVREDFDANPRGVPRGVSTGDVLAGAVNLEVGRRGRADEMRVASILRRAGWHLGPRRDFGGIRVRTYEPGEAFVNDAIRLDAEEVGPEVGRDSERENKPQSNVSNLSNHRRTHTGVK